MTRFYSLTVQKITDEISGSAKSLYFETPEQTSSLFNWKAGQHVTLRFNLNGEEYRRSYSISVAPGQSAFLRVTVKRVQNGLISNHINDNLSAGQKIEVMPPFGDFTITPQPRARRTYYLFAAGSGFTPIFAMLQTILQEEAWANVHLLYANKDKDSILFLDKLQEYEEVYADRLTVSHILSKPSFWSGFKPWDKGRADPEKICRFIEAHRPYAQDTRYYICGPADMNNMVTSTLKGIDVPSERIFCEFYGGAKTPDEEVISVGAAVKMRMKGQNEAFTVGSGQSLLAGALTAKLSPPYSCQSGVCGACKTKLIKGKVRMLNRSALNEKDLKNGTILTCQSYAETENIEIRFDD